MVHGYRAKFRTPAGHTINIIFYYVQSMMNCTIEQRAGQELELKLRVDKSGYKLLSITECR